MIERKVYNIDEVDLTIPPGGIVSVSQYTSRPHSGNKLELIATGLFIQRLGGKQVSMRKGLRNNYEDVCFRDGHGEIVVIDRDAADDPDTSYAIIPYRLLHTPGRQAFAKNFVIIDRTLSSTPYMGVALSVGSDPNFIPIRAESILGEDLTLAINSL